MQHERDMEPAVAELPLAEIDMRIALLPPISRGAHLAGPGLHAERLLELWRVDDGDEVPLAQAWRLLAAEAVEGAIARTIAASEHGYPGDARHWIFPPLADLLPELQALAWQAMLDGELLVQAIKGERGTRPRAVLPAELVRLTPDWDLSRLMRAGRDEFIDVQARRPPREPAKATWRTDKPSDAEVADAMRVIAQGYPPGAQPAFEIIWTALKARLKRQDLPRKVAYNALKQYAPHLRGRRGYRSTKSPS
jgi:hypothetical protein